MAKLMDKQILTCALGALNTVHAIDRVIPVLHSGPGCAAKLSGNYDGVSGLYSPNIFPCSSCSEKEVVFGGTRKLQQTIDNALKVIDADLFVVMTGCTQELIGDDVGDVVRQFQDQGKPVVYANTPGFKGSNLVGHDWVLKGIFDQYVEPVPESEKEKGLVNLFVSVPFFDPFWLGNLKEIERLLTAIGLKVNRFFGHGCGVENLKRAAKAEATIVVSPWTSVPTAQFLDKKFGVPCLHYPVMPIGAFETSKFLRAVAEFTNLDEVRVNRFIQEQEAEYYYYIERYADLFLETRAISKRFTVVSDSNYALAVTKFLTNDMGMFPNRQFILDDAPKKAQEQIKEEFQNLNYGVKAEVEFTTDGTKVHDEIRQQDFAGPAFIFGSCWEERLAKDLGGNFLCISQPTMTRIVINSFYAGYEGGLRLIEDMYTKAVEKLAI